MFRRKESRRTGRRYFSRTASNTKSVNLGDRIYRGGIRF